MIAYDALLAAGSDWPELCKRAMFHGGVVNVPLQLLQIIESKSDRQKNAFHSFFEPAVSLHR